jgi:hypothetical protein
MQGALKVNQRIRLSPAPAKCWKGKEAVVWGISVGKLQRSLAPPGVPGRPHPPARHLHLGRTQARTGWYLCSAPLLTPVLIG